MKKIKVYTDFKCPECKGFMFGTSNTGKEYEKGHCHDFFKDGSKCSFKWNRPSEDKKVFQNYFYSK